MSEEVRKKWVQALNILSENPSSKVLCPNCSNDYLIIKTVLVEEYNKKDMYLICPSCNSYNVATAFIVNP